MKFVRKFIYGGFGISSPREREPTQDLCEPLTQDEVELARDIERGLLSGLPAASS